MGLDMYLSQQVYISNYAHAPEGQKVAKAVMEALGVDPKQYLEAGGITVELPVAYWRKANAIHGWFVQNVQNGEDNCASYYVSRDALIELRDLCKRVLAGEATKDELPPTPGFFFGNTNDDKWYRSDLENTVEQLDKAMSLDEAVGSFYYRSSW